MVVYCCSVSPGCAEAIERWGNWLADTRIAFCGLPYNDPLRSGEPCGVSIDINVIYNKLIYIRSVICYFTCMDNVKIAILVSNKKHIMCFVISHCSYKDI